MVSAITPLGIFVGAAAAIALAFYGVWDLVNASATRRVETFSDLLDRGGITRKPQEIVLSGVILIAVVWVSLLLLLGPTFWLGAALLPAVVVGVAAAYYLALIIYVQRRLNAFLQQLEMSLRLIASGVRIGLGLKQALSIVIEEMPDPARYEFMRIIGQTNIGVSIYDALDDLAERMPSGETKMLARVIRVQSTTGGDLTGILEQQADTIKERRRIQRKIRALTAEGRAGAAILSLVPLALGTFIAIMERNMGHALLFTTPGHVTLLIVLLLELTGAFWMWRILQVRV